MMTMARKIGCTNVTKKCNPRQATLVNRQMCHDPAVAARYYEAVRGERDAVEAVEVLHDLE